MTYIIVYLWEGERHSTSKAWTSLSEAKRVLRKFHQLKWRAWIEEISAPVQAEVR